MTNLNSHLPQINKEQIKAIFQNTFNFLKIFLINNNMHLELYKLEIKPSFFNRNNSTFFISN